MYGLSEFYFDFAGRIVGDYLLDQVVEFGLRIWTISQKILTGTAESFDDANRSTIRSSGCDGGFLEHSSERAEQGSQRAGRDDLQRNERGKKVQAQTRVSPETSIEVAAERLDEVFDDGDT